jgi:hypothetical protein
MIKLRAGRKRFGSRQRLGILLFVTAFRPTLGPIQPPIQWFPGDLSLGIKRSVREGDHSPPASAEVRNAWSHASTHPYVFMAWCSVKYKKYRMRLRGVVLC